MSLSAPSRTRRFIPSAASAASAQVQGMEGEIVVMQEIFRFVEHGVDANGKVIGEIKTTGMFGGSTADPRHKQTLETRTLERKTWFLCIQSWRNRYEHIGTAR